MMKKNYFSPTMTILPFSNELPVLASTSLIGTGAVVGYEDGDTIETRKEDDHSFDIWGSDNDFIRNSPFED